MVARYFRAIFETLLRDGGHRALSDAPATSDCFKRMAAEYEEPSPEELLRQEIQEIKEKIWPQHELASKMEEAPTDNIEEDSSASHS